MAATTFLVTQVTGLAWVRGANGSLTRIHQGMRVPVDADIVTSAGASVQLQANGVPLLTIGENRDVQLSAAMVQVEVDPAAAAVVPPADPDVARVLAALEAGADPLEELDPTAAVLDGGAGDGGSRFTRLIEVVETTTPLAIEYPRSGGAWIEGGQSIGPEDDVDARSVSRGGDSGVDRGVDGGIGDGDGGAGNGDGVGTGNIGTGGSDTGGSDTGGGGTGDGGTGDGGTGEGGTGDGGTGGGGTGGGGTGGGDTGGGGTGGGNGDDPAVQFPAPTLYISDGNGIGPGQLTIAEDEVRPVSGSFTVSTPAGLAFLAIGGTTLTAAQINNVASTPVIIQTAKGQITLIGFNAKTGSLTYAFTVGGPQDHSAGNESVVDTIAVVIIDSLGRQAAGSIGVHITDTAPSAVSENGGALVEDSPRANEIYGNVLDNDGIFDGPGSVSWNGSENAQVFSRLEQFGTIVLGTDGRWSFTLDSTKSAVQALAEGQEVEFQISYIVTDGDGDTAQAELTFKLVGTNDVPVISSDAAAAAGSVTEAGSGGDGAVVPGAATVSGTLASSDVDTGAKATWSLVGISSYGVIAIDPATGKWTYTLDNSKAETQALKEGDSKTETFTATVIDEFGATATQLITITINGTNDAPTVSSDAKSVTEDVDVAGDMLSVAGAVTISDADSGEAAFDTATLAFGTTTAVDGKQLGSIAMNADGTYTYQVANAAVQHLKAGESVVETYTVTSADGTATSTITITINGTNDVPTVSSDAKSVTEDANTTDGTLSVTGAVTISDADSGEAAFNTATLAFGTTTAVDGKQLGSIAMNADGTYTYSVANGAVQHLKAGESVVETYTVKSADGSASSSITITIHGTNDVPTVSSDAKSVTEDANTTNGTLSVTGAVTIEDADTGEAAFNTATLALGTTTAVGGAPLGTISMAADGTYTYQVANAAVQHLKAGESVVETYTVTSADGTATSTITITINGTNDAPTVSSDAKSVTEDANTTDGMLSVAGAVTITDSDSGETAFNTATLAFGTTTAVDGKQLGSIAMNADGTYTYQVVNAAVQHLRAGESVVETYTVKSADGTATSTITITINGTNDTPTVSSDAKSVTEDVDVAGDMLSVTGAVAIEDADTGEAAFNTATLALGTTTAAGGAPLGTISMAADGTYTYQVANAAVQHLKAGESVVETYTVKSADGSASSSITITIHGTNDVPTVSSDAKSVTEDANTTDGTLSVTGAVTITDSDSGEAAFNTATLAFGTTTAVDGKQLGSIAMNADGTYTYQVVNAAVQHLKAGESVVETYTVKSADGTATSTITITINGTNDVPVITSDASAAAGSVIESGNADDGAVVPGTATISGALTSSDVDAGAKATWSVTGTSAYGSIAIDPATGQWTYTLDNAKADTQALKAGDSRTETFTATVTDEFGAVATQLVTITINGTNDVATVSSDAQSVTEDVAAIAGVLRVHGAVTVTDVDAGQNEFDMDSLTFGTTTAVGGTQLGAITMTADGTYTYSVANKAVQYLKAGESIVETYTVKSADGTAVSTITITINGTNDVPIVSNDAKSVTEDVNVVGGSLSVTGAVTILSADAGQNEFDLDSVAFGTTTAAGGTQLGVITMAADGTYTYRVANDAVQYLKAGQSIVETYTVKSADGAATSTITITINGTNDVPVIQIGDSSLKVSISEEGLSGGIPTKAGGEVDSTNSVTASGKVAFSDVDSDDIHNVSLTVPTTALASNGVMVQWELLNDGKALKGFISDDGARADIITATIDNTGNFEVTLSGPIDHPVKSVEDVLKFNIGVQVIDASGAKATTTLTVNIEDDSPSVGQSGHVTEATTVGIPDVFTGKVDFTKASNSTHSQISFSGGAVLVTAKGFAGAADLNLVDAKVGQGSGGLGVASVASPYHNIANEVDYRKLSGTEARSEELTIQLTGGKVAYGASIDFGSMFGGEREVGVAHFYLGDVLIATRNFTSTASSGNYAATFNIREGAFDRIVLQATDNGNVPRSGDNSDFSVKGIEFFGTTDVALIATAEGSLDAEYGADGRGANGGIMLTSTTVSLLTAEGLAITTGKSATTGVFEGRDSAGNLIFEVHLSQDTGKWQLLQYQPMQPATGGGSTVAFTFTVTDADGDSAEGSFLVAPVLVPVGEAPTAEGHAISGTEDTPLVLAWENFGVTHKFPSAQLGVVIIGLPANGTLQYQDGNGGWNDVSVGQTITKADIDGGKLQFVPGQNESGIDGYGGNGVGNMKADYAHIIFKPTAGESVGETTSLSVDIRPVADAPLIELTLGVPVVVDAGTAKTFILPGGKGVITVDGDMVSATVNGKVYPQDYDNGKFPNGNPNSNSGTTDIFALIGEFDALPRATTHIFDITGVDGGTSDYVYLSKDKGAYLITDIVDNGPGLLAMTIRQVDVNGTPYGTAIRFNNMQGVIFGDGQAVGKGTVGIQVQAGDAGYQLVEVHLSVNLTDDDGSESLSGIKLMGIADGVTFQLADGVTVLTPSAGTLVLTVEQLVGLQMVVPNGTAAFALQASATSREAANQAEITTDSAPTEFLPTPIPDSGDNDNGAGDEDEDGNGNEDTSGSLPAGTDFLINGDFSQFSNTTEHWAGNIYGGFKGWTSTGSFDGDYWRMEGKPYVGVWEESSRDVALKQAVSGVEGGAVVQLQVAWNNPNHGQPGGGTASAPDDTGNGVRLEISFGGVVYAVIITPLAGTSVANSQYAAVFAQNGASVDVHQIHTWTQRYDWFGGDSPRPADLSVFETLNITLPDNVAHAGELQLHWIAGSEGGDYTDDLMIANVKLLAGGATDAMIEPLSAMGPGGLAVDDEAVSLAIDDSGQDISLHSAGHEKEGVSNVMHGEADFDTFEWTVGDEGSIGIPDVDTVVSADSSAAGDNGDDVLDLGELLVDEEAQAADLDQYLQFGTADDEDGTVDAVVPGNTSRDGAAAQFSPKIGTEGMDLLDAYGVDQHQLIQQLIHEAKAKVDAS